MSHTYAAHIIHPDTEEPKDWKPWCGTRNVVYFTIDGAGSTCCRRCEALEAKHGYPEQEE